MDKFNLEAFAETLKSISVKTASALRDLLADATAESNGEELNARGRLEALFDKGTFSEIGTYVRRRAGEFDADAKDGFEAVICGWGAVDGRLVYAFSQDISRTSGSLSEAHARKICELYRLATENGAPVIGIFDSAGAYLPEGVRALAGYGKVMKAVSAASGVIPQIAVVSGYAAGASAVICGMFDIVITTEKGSVSVNAPSFTKGAGTAETMADTGVTAISVSDDLAALTAAKDILLYLPSNNAEGTADGLSLDTVNREVSLATYESSKDAHDLISAVVDGGKLIELYASYAPEMVCGLASVGGTAVGVVATNKAQNGGVLTAKAARKASRMVSLLDSFNIPVITFVDSAGLDKSEGSEMAPYTAELAKLASAYAATSSPVVTLIAGEAYGSVFTVLGSKALGADLVLALDCAKVASMNASSAVAFLWNDEITANVTREDLEKRWDDAVATPVEAASSGEIDDIIASGETRQRIGAAVSMLSAKSTYSASRRHLIMPL